MLNPFDEISAKLDGLETLVLDLRNQVQKIEPAEQGTRRFISAREAADYLNLAMQTVYGLVNQGKIPFHKRGNRLYFDKGELEAWITQTEAENVK